MCIYPGITSTRNFCKFCRAVIPVPGSPVSSVRPCHNTRNFWKFCETFKPVPELLLILLDIHTRTRNFCEFCAPRATIPGVRVQHLLYSSGTSMSSVRPCLKSRNFCKFCNIFIPVPETSWNSIIIYHTHIWNAQTLLNMTLEDFVETHLCTLCVFYSDRAYIWRWLSSIRIYVGYCP